MADIIKLCPDSDTADQLLESAKGEFDAVLIIGMSKKDGYLTVVGNIEDPPVRYWMLANAQDIVLHADEYE